jgi:hypothetical protein
MEWSTARPKFGICLILDDSIKLTDLTKTTNAVLGLNNFVQVKDQPTDNYILTGVSPETRIEVYIGVGRKLPKRIKDKIQLATEDDFYIPSSRSMWFEGKDYSYDQIKQRLTQWAKENGCVKIFVADINSDLSGDLLSKFKSI